MVTIDQHVERLERDVEELRQQREFNEQLTMTLDAILVALTSIKQSIES